MQQYKKKSRRNFISTTVKGSVALGIGLSFSAEFLASCNVSKKSIKNTFATGFTQKPLSYKYDGLEIDYSGTKTHKRDPCNVSVSNWF